MQARLSFSAYYLKNQPITLLGARMKDVPNFWVIMDNGYVYIFMTFGIVVFALFCAGYAVLIARYSGFLKARKGVRLQELSIIFAFLLYGIMEQFISNAFMNLSLLFLGEVLFGPEGAAVGCAGEESASGYAICKRNEKRKWFFGAGAGIVAAVLYLAFIPKKEYVLAPLDSLLYVDAWSVEVGVGGSERGTHTKEELNGLMDRCRLLIEKPEVMEKAIRAAGLEGKLSPEEAAAAMEYSLPVSVHSSEIYDRFRIRLLELYCRMDGEEYARLMNQVVQTVERSEEPLYRVDAGSVYQERIEKSAGKDRIEHMSGEKEYLVEKNGSIVIMEHFRDSIFYGIMVMAVIILLWSLPGWRRQRSRWQEELRKEWGQQ